MDILKLRNEIIAAIDKSRIKARNEDDYFCASVEHSTFEHHDTLEVNFYTHSPNTVFYTFEQNKGERDISVNRRYEKETENISLGCSEAMEEIRNNFKKMGVEFDGKYI